MKDVQVGTVFEKYIYPLRWGAGFLTQNKNMTGVEE